MNLLIATAGTSVFTTVPKCTHPLGPSPLPCKSLPLHWTRSCRQKRSAYLSRSSPSFTDAFVAPFSVASNVRVVRALHLRLSTTIITSPSKILTITTPATTPAVDVDVVSVAPALLACPTFGLDSRTNVSRVVGDEVTDNAHFKSKALKLKL